MEGRPKRNSQELFVEQILNEVDNIPTEVNTGSIGLDEILEDTGSRALSPAAENILQTPNVRLGVLPKKPRPSPTRETRTNPIPTESRLNSSELFENPDILEKENMLARRETPAGRERTARELDEKIEQIMKHSRWEATAEKHIPQEGTPVTNANIKCVVAHIKKNQKGPYGFDYFVQFLQPGENFTDMVIPSFESLDSENIPEISYTLYQANADKKLTYIGSTKPSSEQPLQKAA